MKHFARLTAVALTCGLILTGILGTRPLPETSSPPRSVRVLLLYDMEGVTDAEVPADVNFGTSTYEATRASLVEDVNAAIRGLMKGGATEVVVVDGHGSGNQDPDYILDQMPEGARHEIRDEPFDPYIDLMDQQFDAMVAIAMHSRAGSKGFIPHTYNGHTRWVMGGHEMNESMLVAASAARYGTPLILVTGDNVLGEEVKAFSSQIEYVVVKHAVAIDSAAARPRAEVSAEIEAAAERAIRARASIQPWNPPLPAEFENHYGYVMPEQAAAAINFPKAQVVNDKTVSVRTTNFLDAYLTFRALASFTSLATQRVILQAIRNQEGAAEFVREAQQKIPNRHERTFEPTGTTIPRSLGTHGYR